MPNIALELGKQSAAFGVQSAYGEQQDVDGIRVIPVALTWSGFGGGSPIRKRFAGDPGGADGFASEHHGEAQNFIRRCS